ncbi:MAG: alpha/beta fold hydrolase [Proteobacteria bacterium]|nr:alpha/beta fold hydrolase [Pseudomonadota bacterium]MBU1583593.1 alpha/beta fold hydrolase [Pseudomonadota bacterium]MBU2452484.1 alpha/beta fold hydrolase [Pseudomonadota bacterium]MBU2628661.1 alpha/beta fold hydrolase [Pseudomonadota bacterium]
MIQQQIRFCRTPDGVRLAYAVAGSGPPLVKTANWLSHIEYEWQSPVWRHWYENLARHFTLIRYDQRGCGLSDWDVKSITFDSWVQDLECVVKAVGLEKFPLLGISQGGAVAVAYAKLYPKKVSHLILYGSYLRGRLNRNLKKQQVEETDVLINLIRLGWGSEKPAFRQVFTTLFIPDATLGQIQSLNELHKISTSAENAVKIVNCFDKIDVSDLSARIETPTLILHSKDDARVPFEEGRLAASLIPGAQFIMLESKNHILLASEPAWQKFIKSILDFIDSKKDGIKKVKTFSKFSLLTHREKQVLELIAQGINNNEIAVQLFVSPKTIRNHITNIFGKLEISNRSKIIVMAREAGMGHGIEKFDK